MNINAQLESLYNNHFENGIHAISEKYEGNLDGPLLMYCWEEQYNIANKKILFIGQEANGWVGEAMNEIERPLKKYKDFNLGKDNLGKYYNSPFWRTLRSLNTILNPTLNENSFLWTNVSKYSTYEGKPITFEDHKYIIGRMNILPEEIKIIKPDIVIFFSGPDYDEKINIQFGSSLIFKSLYEHIPSRELAKVDKNKASFLPLETYRTYHPRYLQKDKYRISRINYIQVIAASILGYNINESITTFKKQLFNLIENIKALNLGLEFEISQNFGQNQSGFYCWKASWKYCAIGFQFEAHGFGDFAYGICRKDAEKDIPENLKRQIQYRFQDNSERPNDIWPYWKWFEHKNWNIETFYELNKGSLVHKIKDKLDYLISKIEYLEL